MSQIAAVILRQDVSLRERNEAEFEESAQTTSHKCEPKTASVKMKFTKTRTQIAVT